MIVGAHPSKYKKIKSNILKIPLKRNLKIYVLRKKVTYFLRPQNFNGYNVSLVNKYLTFRTSLSKTIKFTNFSSKFCEKQSEIKNI